jgi:hypothetical protein
LRLTHRLFSLIKTVPFQLSLGTSGSSPFLLENRTCLKLLAQLFVDCFSIFRRFDTADTVIEVAIKLAQQGDDLAVTHTAQGFVAWVYEPEAKLASEPKSSLNRMQLPTYGPAPCFLVSDTSHYKPCYIKVPDLPRHLVAIYYARRFYSVYRRGLKAEEAFEIATKLVSRGDEVAIAPAKLGYAVCVWEPEAIPYKPEVAAGTQNN